MAVWILNEIVQALGVVFYLEGRIILNKIFCDQVTVKGTKIIHT